MVEVLDINNMGGLLRPHKDMFHLKYYPPTFLAR